MEQGKVIIGCRLDSKQLEKDLKNSEKELQKYEKEAEKLTEAKAKIDIDLQEYEKQKQLIQASTDETLKLAQTEEQVKNVLDLEKMELEELNQKYSAQFQKQSEINKKIEDNAISQSMLNDKIQETSQKLKQVKGFEQIKNEINEVNKGLTKTIKNAGKWALGIFGIRSAYNAVRSAMSTLSQYDDQMASNIQYITYALANTLKPVIETILNLIVKLLQYINYIAKAWTGKNLFKTADAFKNAQKNAKGLNKELQKTTASFDEINKVSSQGSSTGGADISTPNIDLTGMQGETPEWLQWIVDHKDDILAVMGGIAAGLLAWNLGFSGLKGLGIAAMITGVVLAIEGLLGYLNDPTWDNFGKIVEGIGLFILGLGIITGNVTLIIAGAIVTIVGLLVRNWEDIKNGMDTAISWINNSVEKMIDFFTEKLGWFGTFLGAFLGTIPTGVAEVIELIKETLDGLFSGVKQILDGIIMIFRGDFKNGIITVGKGIVNVLIGIINGLIAGINLMLLPLRAVIVALGKIGGKKISFNTVKLPYIPKLAKGGIINQPGRGVPVGYGQATGGERGQEGVLPLTDSQQMALLGEAIGKYVRIDNVIDVNMDSRRINRILQSSSNRTAFASNR